jgi:hypothetical protein
MTNIYSWEFWRISQAELIEQALVMLDGLEESISIYRRLWDDELLPFIESILESSVLQSLAGNSSVSFFIRTLIHERLLDKLWVIGASHDGTQDDFSLARRIEKYFALREYLESLQRSQGAFI